MRLVFFGSDAIALPALEYLHWAEGVELVAVVSQPDRPSGRGRHLHANPVSAWAVAHGVPLLQPEKPGPEEVAWLRAQRLELSLVMAYGHILKHEILEVALRGTWNLHASLLPKYRGASPVETALVSGDTDTGVSLMGVVKKMDAGPVAATVQVPIQKNDTSLLLREHLAQACVPLLQRHLATLGSSTCRPVPQDETQVTYTRKLTKADANVDFAAPAVELERRVRAFQPWPGVAVDHRGTALKVGTAAVLPDAAEIAPGTIVQAGNAGVDVATGSGLLRLLTLQRPGGRMLSAAEFLHGYKLEVGERLTSQPMRPLVSATPFAREK
jgi:methionyl-tRNA formyltransferase